MLANLKLDKLNKGIKSKTCLYKNTRFLIVQGSVRQVCFFLHICFHYIMIFLEIKKDQDRRSE